MQLKDVQEHVMEAASRLTSAIKPEIAKMLMELSAGAANFTDQKEFSLQDIEVEYLLCHAWVRKYMPEVSENVVLVFSPNHRNDDLCTLPIDTLSL